jgi:hypothetical protein
MTRLTPNRLIALTGALSMCVTLAMPLDSQATARVPPSVYTGTYVGASTSTASFRGSVNPHGLETVYAFQFGPTTGYGAQTVPASVGGGTAEVKVSQAVSGLQPGAIYHVRIVATSGAGTTYGQDVMFTTRQIPLAFKVVAAPNPVVFGNSFSVKGVLTGTEAAGREVILQANPFPYRGIFREISHPVVTDARGNFSFPVANILKTTQFRIVGVGAQPVSSSTFVERVASRVSLHLGSAGRPGFVRMYGTIEPSEVGASVSFQLLSPGGASLNVGWTKAGRATTSASRFSRNVRIPRSGLYRAVVHVNNGMQVPGYSRALSVR